MREEKRCDNVGTLPTVLLIVGMNRECMSALTLQNEGVHPSLGPLATASEGRGRGRGRRSAQEFDYHHPQPAMIGLAASRVPLLALLNSFTSRLCFCSSHQHAPHSPYRPNLHRCRSPTWPRRQPSKNSSPSTLGLEEAILDHAKSYKLPQKELDWLKQVSIPSPSPFTQAHSHGAAKQC